MHHQPALIRQTIVFLAISCLISLTQCTLDFSPSSMAVNSTTSIIITITNDSINIGKSQRLYLTIPNELTFVDCVIGSSSTIVTTTPSTNATNYKIGGGNPTNVTLNLTLKAPSFTYDNLTLMVQTLTSIYTLNISVYLNPSLPKPMICSITKSSNTTLLIHDFTTKCSIGSLGVNPSNYIGIIIPPYVSQIITNNRSVSLTVNNNVTYSGGETLICKNQTTNSFIFGDLNGYCILYVIYNSSAPALT